ncbi:MAG TPA: DNA repair protein RecO [Verrucomicrobiae bacterium]|nr:DNA repair protein RecO [Verrucomicrobiae bacterium]
MATSESATGIILRTRPFTETSLIVNWLTAEQGRISTVARGARRPKSPFTGKLDLFYLADLSFARSQRSELHTLREINLRETHHSLREELGYLQQAAYCAALVEQATEPDTPLPDIFELMRSLLTHLPRQAPLPQTTFVFELKLLDALGLSPDLADARLTPGARQIARLLLNGDWPASSRLKLSDAQVAELRRFLHGFLIFHLGKIPKGRH